MEWSFVMRAESLGSNGSAGRSSESSHLELVGPVGPVPLGFVVEAAEIFLVARERSARWPTSVLCADTTTLKREGTLVSGRAELVPDPAEKARILGLFRSKYGNEQFDRWYANPARVIRVRPISASDRTDRKTRYRNWLEAEFDNVADQYDGHITGNRVNRLLRDRSLAELRRVFRSARYLLEIGCGSGMETLPLLAEGHEILCVDVSERMLAVVREKAKAAGLSEALRTVRLPAGRLAELGPMVAGGPFHGAYSTYGAMNCEEEIAAVPPALFRLLVPGAQFAAGVYNRWCLFELLGYGLTGRWSRAFGRVGSPVRVGRSRFCVDVFAYSVGEFRALFDPWFQPERLEAVPALLPPSDLTAYAERFSRRWDVLTRVDRSVGRWWPFRSLGDHFLLTFTRRPEPAPRAS